MKDKKRPRGHSELTHQGPSLVRPEITEAGSALSHVKEGYELQHPPVPGRDSPPVEPVLGLGHYQKHWWHWWQLAGWGLCWNVDPWLLGEGEWQGRWVFLFFDDFSLFREPEVWILCNMFHCLDLATNSSVFRVLCRPTQPLCHWVGSGLVGTACSPAPVQSSVSVESHEIYCPPRL